MHMQSVITSLGVDEPQWKRRFDDLMVKSKNDGMAELGMLSINNKNNATRIVRFHCNLLHRQLDKF